MTNHLSAAVYAGILAPSVTLFGFFLAVRPEDLSVGQPFTALFLPIIFATPAVLLYGLPMFLVLRKFHLANIFTCVALALAPILVAAFTIPMLIYMPVAVVLFTLLCLSSALAFWYFARKTI